MRIGVDLGGTKIAAVALDETGAQCAMPRILTLAGDSAAIAGPVADREARTGAQAQVGTGRPGVITPAAALVKNTNSTCLNDRAFAADIEAALGRPLRLANVANCFAVSEATEGAFAKLHTVFGAILGAGVAGVLVSGGRLPRGPDLIASEWLYKQLPWMAASAHPGLYGRDGCIETSLSGPGLAAEYVRGVSDQIAAEAVVHRTAVGERLAERSLARYEHHLARAIAHVIKVFDTDAILLGGGLSQLRELGYSVPKQWGNWVFSCGVDILPLHPVHGDASGVRGAAWKPDAGA